VPGRCGRLRVYPYAGAGGGVNVRHGGASSALRSAEERSAPTSFATAGRQKEGRAFQGPQQTEQIKFLASTCSRRSVYMADAADLAASQWHNQRFISFRRRTGQWLGPMPTQRRAAAAFAEWE